MQLTLPYEDFVEEAVQGINERYSAAENSLYQLANYVKEKVEEGTGYGKSKEQVYRDLSSHRNFKLNPRSLKDYDITAGFLTGALKRQPNVPFSTTKEVAKSALTDEDKEVILQVAEDKQMTQKQVRQEINKVRLDKIKEAAFAEGQVQETKPIIKKMSVLDWIYQNNETERFDLVITDPPYMTDVDDIEGFVDEWFSAILGCVKSTGRAYICVGAYPKELQTYLNVWYECDEHAKLSPALYPQLTLENVLVWTYRNTIGPSPKDKYKTNWQAILYFKGHDAPPLNCPIMTEQFSVQDINAPDGRLGNRFHEWQKPDELAERLIRHSTKEGDTVFDPFAGTGTFLLAASRLGRIATGLDISDDSLSIAKNRGCKILRSEAA